MLKLKLLRTVLINRSNIEPLELFRGIDQARYAKVIYENVIILALNTLTVS